MQLSCKDNEDVKYARLVECIAQLGSAAVAVSGGSDSSLLVKAAVDALGSDNMATIAVRTEVSIKRELHRAQSLCGSLGVPLLVIDVSLLSNPLFVNNPPNRCYVCKRTMFTAIKEAVFARGILHVIEGTNASDCVADRPGFDAIKELGAVSPLRECALTKSDVRKVSKYLGLDTWDVPSNSCLATRFPYNEMLDVKRLALVERAEDFLITNGVSPVRVRVGAHDE